MKPMTLSSYYKDRPRPWFLAVATLFAALTAAVARPQTTTPQPIPALDAAGPGRFAEYGIWRARRSRQGHTQAYALSARHGAFQHRPSGPDADVAQQRVSPLVQEANHFARAGSEPVVVQISGVGPTDTRYADQPSAEKPR
jgi:hypothetical protein